MRHAEFVCTNSFHGVCFSLINKKNFVVLPTKAGQSRLEDVLQTAGLVERLARRKDELEPCIATVIDHERVAFQLDEARERSHAFLRAALS